MPTNSDEPLRTSTHIVNLCTPISTYEQRRPSANDRRWCLRETLDRGGGPRQLTLRSDQEDWVTIEEERERAAASHSVTQSIRQPTSQSVNQSVRRPVNESVHQSVSQSRGIAAKRMCMVPRHCRKTNVHILALTRCYI